MEGDLSDLRANTAGLEPRVRSSRHASGVSLLALARADLVVIEGQINAQASTVVEVHRRAIGLLQQLHAEVLQCRKANVEAALEREFNFSKLHIPAATVG